MRIAILHYSKPPTIGGVERVIGQQASALTALGHHVEILTRQEWHDAAWDVVIVHNVFTMPFDLAWTHELIDLAAQATHTRWVNWVHDIRWSEKVPHALHVAVSEHRRQQYAQITSEPITLIPNGCDAAGILGLTQRISALQLEKAPLVLLHPTRFVRRKNIEMGLRLLSELPEALYIITAAPDPHQGDGRLYFEELATLAEKLDVRERVLFLGESAPLSDDDVRSLYQLADALFFPSTQEGYGLPLIEAALHQLPIFCSDIPAHREVAPSEATFFHLTDSIPSLAHKLRSHPAVQARQQRRQLIARLDWPRLLETKLLPLFSRTKP
ncbi:MAG: glycosyltransferase family 4 protein [Verrucomicrobiaceae bacterium]|nr:glycosyltransferase family 4 protein [Verrucomicrobiaceae bacterium]